MSIEDRVRKVVSEQLDTNSDIDINHYSIDEDEKKSLSATPKFFLSLVCSSLVPVVVFFELYVMWIWIF